MGEGKLCEVFQFECDNFGEEYVCFSHHLSFVTRLVSEKAVSLTDSGFSDLAALMRELFPGGLRASFSTRWESFP